MYGVLIESIGKNKYKIQFDNGAMNGVQSSILQLKQITFGLSPQKLLLQHPTIQVMLITAVLATVLTTESSSFGSSSLSKINRHLQTNLKIQWDISSQLKTQIDEDEYVSLEGIDNDAVDVVEEDGMGLEQEMNIGDKNIPAYEDILPLKYFQRLEATRKMIKQFLGKTVTKVKTKIKISITWTIVEESVSPLETKKIF